MRLRNKKTGEIIREAEITVRTRIPEEDEGETLAYDAHGEFTSIAELDENWEDYKPVEPIFDKKIRRGIRAWWDMQDNPFKSARVMLKSRVKDLDGLYHWRIFAYIRNGEERISTDMEFRTKNLYDYNSSHDYTKEELCGEDEE